MKIKSVSLKNEGFKTTSFEKKTDKFVTNKKKISYVLNAT